MFTQIKNKKHRIFYPEKLEINTIINIDTSNHHYITKVLRAKKNQIIKIFNNSEYIFYAKIITINKKNSLLKITKSKFTNKESFINIHLGQCITANDKMNIIIQKTTELGVNQITPILSENNRSLNKFFKVSEKIKRWNKITISACQQCNRNIVPNINKPIDLTKWINKRKIYETNIICNLNATKYLQDIKLISKDIFILIGPERGFSSNEKLFLSKQNNLININLGPRILRTETASIAAVTALQLIFGDLSKQII